MTSTGFSPQARVLLVALKRYGLILADNGSSYLVTFLSAPLPAEIAARVEAEDFSPNVHAVAGLELYSWAPNGVQGLTLTDTSVMSRGGGVATSRNWNTVEKIVAAL